MSHHRPWETKKLEGAEAERVIQQIVRAMPFYKWGCRLARIFNVVFFVWFIAGIVGNGLFFQFSWNSVANFSLVGLNLYCILGIGPRMTRYKINIVNVEDSISRFHFKIFVEVGVFMAIYGCLYIVSLCLQRN
jgi:hypothetical protein